MSKEILKPSQFRKAEKTFDEESFLLNNEQKNELSSLYEGQVGKFKTGTIIKGHVLKVTPDGVLVDIDYKSEGFIPNYEFSEHEIKKLAPGFEIDVVLDELENAEGNVVLSYEKAKTMKAWTEIMKLFEENKPVEGVVLNKVKGGLSVDIGIPAFLPGSQIDVQRVTDFDALVGQTIQAYIIKINQKRGNVIISRRKYIHEQKSEVRKKILDMLQEGQVIQGVVKNITNYGVFIDVGGLDGLLHITDMTWSRINHPSELVKIGDTITVKVLSFDKVNEKVSLGMKQLTPNPWQETDVNLEVGAKVKGHISSIRDYGVFLEIHPGLGGLIHISEISWTERITDLNKYFKIGQEVEAVIVSIDKDTRRMSLSIKQLEKNPWDVIAEQYQPGQVIKGKISNIIESGIFVQIAPGIDGLVRVSDFSWTEYVDHVSDKYKKGDEIEAVILSINKQAKKISLGIKQLTPNPWEEIEKTYPVGSIVEGEVTKIANFGAFVKLPNGIEGLVHISELSPNNVEKVEDILKVGQVVPLKVIKSSQEEHKIGLSLKAAVEDKAKESAKKEAKAKKEVSNDKDKKKAKSEQSYTQKPKSLLQIELEKHAARQKEALKEE